MACSCLHAVSFRCYLHTMGSRAAATSSLRRVLAAWEGRRAQTCSTGALQSLPGRGPTLFTTQLSTHSLQFLHSTDIPSKFLCFSLYHIPQKYPDNPFERRIHPYQPTDTETSGLLSHSFFSTSQVLRPPACRLPMGVRA